jgi:hypothetical protein
VLGSGVEAAANVAVGFILAPVAQSIVFPLFDIVMTMATDIGIAPTFTVLSFVRSYLVWRLFEKIAAMTFQSRKMPMRGCNTKLNMRDRSDLN